MSVSIAESTPPKVYISYSHDSAEHVRRVLNLANRLRGDGIDCPKIRSELSPEADANEWSRKQIVESRFVLVVCSEIYERRFREKEEPGIGQGSWFEGMLIRQELNMGPSNRKYVPIIFDDVDRRFIPRELQSYTFYSVGLAEGFRALVKYLMDRANEEQPSLDRGPRNPSAQQAPPVRSETPTETPHGLEAEAADEEPEDERVPSVSFETLKQSDFT
jgi:hypothetical protein